MSEVLAARLRAELDVVLDNPNLTRDEMAYELLDAVLPVTEAEYEPEPIWWALTNTPGVCGNCLCTDCACCIGCGAINADIFGSHGYWCAL
jgi:hypothetical protein